MKAKTMLEALHHVHPSRGIFPNSKNCFEGQDLIRNLSCKALPGDFKKSPRSLWPDPYCIWRNTYKA